MSTRSQVSARSLLRKSAPLSSVPGGRPASTRSSGEVEGLGIVRRHGETSTVRAAREHLAESDVLPMAPSVRASEHRHLSDYEDVARRGWADLNAVKIDCMVFSIQAIRDRVPGLSSVATSQKPANLSGRVNVFRLRWVQ